MKLTVLGCGDAFASEGRFNTSFLLQEETDAVLVDCGASTLIRLKQERVDPDSISRIVITHFHGDHYGGLPFLVTCRFVEMGSRKPFTVIGPEGIREKVYQLQEAMYPGTSHMLDELQVQFEVFQDKTWISSGDIDIYARKVKHAPLSNPHGIKLKWREVSFAFSGDTEWIESLIDLADGTDLFICESNNLEKDSPGHLSYQNIIANRERLNAERVYLTHMNTEVINTHGVELVRLADGMIFNL